MQRHGQQVQISEELMEAPIDKIEEAAVLHKFAEAAYTVNRMILLSVFCHEKLNLSHVVQGPLLDFGRNPLSFPCAWVYRQGIFTPWTRNK